MRRIPRFATDEVITSEEMEYLQRGLVNVLPGLLVGRQVFADGHMGRGWDGGPGKEVFKYYKEADTDRALISKKGITQSRAYVMREASRVLVNVVSWDFRLQWRDIQAAKSEGQDLLALHVQAATREIAKTEDELLISGEHTGFEAYGVEGLATATNRNTYGGGAWPANAIDDILMGWKELEADGFYDPPVLILGPTLYKCLFDKENAANDYSVMEYLLRNKIISGALETTNLYSGATQNTTALLVDPDPNYLYYAQGLVPTLVLEDKHGNIFGVVRETIAPIIARDECICELTGLSCA